MGRALVGPWTPGLVLSLLSERTHIKVDLGVAGFLDTDPLSASALPPEGRLSNGLRDGCVFGIWTTSTTLMHRPSSYQLCFAPDPMPSFTASPSKTTLHMVSHTQVSAPFNSRAVLYVPHAPWVGSSAVILQKLVEIIWGHSHSSRKLILEPLMDYTNRRCNHYHWGRGDLETSGNILG